MARKGKVGGVSNKPGHAAVMEWWHSLTEVATAALPAHSSKEKYSTPADTGAVNRDRAALAVASAATAAREPSALGRTYAQ